MSDFESRIATLLNEHVDAELGPQRPAPPLRTDELGRRRRDRARRWVAPLAAACVIAAVLAVVFVIRRHADRPVAPVTPQQGRWQRLSLPDGRGLYGEPTVGLSDGQHGWINRGQLEPLP